MLINFNWIDWIIIGITVYYVIEGWQTGLILLLANLVSFLGSLWLAVKYHGLVGEFLRLKFGLAAAWTNVAGYLIVGVVGEIIISNILGFVLGRLPKKVTTSKANQWLGAAVSAINGLTLIVFFLLLVLALPLRGTIKQDIRSSKISAQLTGLVGRYGGNFVSSFDQITAEAIKFLTIEPKSNERINLDVTPNSHDLAPDPTAEQIMVNFVNNERTKVGVGLLRVDEDMIKVARGHSLEMFVGRYFAHLDSEGHDAAYRMEQAKISFTVVGENLAYAPDVDTAHTGLMNSPGHKRNILDPEFHRIGIGIINGGIYGEMFTQLFAD